MVFRNDISPCTTDIALCSWRLEDKYSVFGPAFNIFIKEGPSLESVLIESTIISVTSKIEHFLEVVLEANSIFFNPELLPSQEHVQLIYTTPTGLYKQ